MQTPTVFLTAADLGRKLNLPASRIVRAVGTNKLVPDGTTEHRSVLLFAPNRLPEIKALLMAPRRQFIA